MIKPAWKQSVDGEANSWANGYKSQLMIAFIDNQINSGEQIELMLDNARKAESPFLPSIGQLVAWALPEVRPPSLALHKEFNDADTKLIAQQASSKEKAKAELAKIRGQLNA